MGQDAYEPAAGNYHKNRTLLKLRRRPWQIWLQWGKRSARGPEHRTPPPLHHPGPSHHHLFLEFLQQRVSWLPPHLLPSVLYPAARVVMALLGSELSIHRPAHSQWKPKSLQWPRRTVPWVLPDHHLASPTTCLTCSSNAFPFSDHLV